jgi:hypothetical protein
MAIQVLQRPNDLQPAQSPVVFSIIENTNAYTASEFQYTANLYIWSGDQTQSGSYVYQARKFPNPVGSGIFDFSRFINSSMSDLSATSGSYLKYYVVDFGWQYESGSTYVSTSLERVSGSEDDYMFKAYDGYSLFPNAINASFQNQAPFNPIMSDSPSVTQSVVDGDISSLGTNLKGLSLFTGQTNGSAPTHVTITASYSTGTESSASYTLTDLGSTTSSLMIQHLPSAPGDSTWSTIWSGVSTGSLANYIFNVYTVVDDVDTLMASTYYEVVCPFYYTPVRIAWKNKYGQFDFLNFYKRHNETFNTAQRVYQPQLGTWESSTLSYNQFQTKQQRYIVDATEVLECNTDWLVEGYNLLMKQLLVSDEIYWLYDQPNALVKPLTIQTNSLQFKTGVNNKLIQYTITFDIGQPYKLIL